MAYIRGKNRAEAFDGTNGNDTIEGRGGNDTLRGLGGDDLLKGGSGNDEVFGGLGNDTVNGGSGEDLLFGDEGNDSLIGANGNDTLDGGTGSDTLRGGRDNDVLIAGEGNDTLDGGDDTDTVIFSGNRQDYTVTQLNATTVIIDGPDGTDRVVRVENFQFADITQTFAEVVQPIDLPEFTMEGPYLSQFNSDFDLGWNDFSTSESATGAGIAATVYIFNTGTISGTATVKAYLSTDGTVSGDDLLLAEETLAISAGGVAEYGPLLSVADTVMSGDYKVIFVVEYPSASGVSNATVVQDVTLVGGRIAATSGDDLIVSTDFNDLIDAGAGDDTIMGSKGLDEVSGGDGFDIVDYSNVDEAVMVLADAVSGNTSVSDRDSTQNMLNFLDGVEGVVGTAFDDGIIMELGLNFADGGAGNDGIQGSATDDTILGGEGNDSILGYFGSDSIDGGAGDDTAYWTGNRDDYVVTQIDANTVEVASADGTDIVTDVEFFLFADGTQTFEELVAPVLSNVAASAAILSGTSVVEGEALTVDWSVSSDGDADAETSTTELVIASAPDMASVIERFGVTQTGPLASGSSASFTGALDTTGFAPGTYYIAAIADSTDLLDESNEADNISGWTEVVIEPSGVTNGTEGNDLFIGTADSETFLGNGGDDTLTGDVLEDTFDGGDGVDTLDFSQMNEGVTAVADLDPVSGTGDETLSIYNNIGQPSGSAENVERVIGTDFADSLGGHASTVRYFDGGAGDDAIVGSTGDDTMLGGTGNDLLFGYFGDDLIATGDGFDLIYAVSSDVYGTAGPNGHDVVTDFDVAMDMLMIVYDPAVETFDPFANLTQTAEGALVTMSADASVLLQGVDMFDLNMANLMGYEDNPNVGVGF